MKMTPSILLNIVLVTVLTTSMFLISTTASTAEYNPWSDIDGDGDIDIYDVVKVTGIYDTSGDPTRNVTVTNWPQTQKPLFPEILSLRGAYYVKYYDFFPSTGVFYRSLLDEKMPYPPNVRNYTYLNGGHPVPTDWDTRDADFTHMSYAQKDYYIQGEVIIRCSLQLYLTNDDLDDDDWVEFYVYVRLQKLDAADNRITLGGGFIHINMTVKASSQNEKWFDGKGGIDHYGLPAIRCLFSTPVLIEAGERLAISFETEMRSKLAKAGGLLNLWHTLGTDEFLATIPIVETP